MPDLLVILIIILVLVVLWRGPKTLPKLGEALGRGVREARREASEVIGPKDDEEKPPAA
jgi:Sec-independent protein translocase protein TatA